MHTSRRMARHLPVGSVPQTPVASALEGTLVLLTDQGAAIRDRSLRVGRLPAGVGRPRLE